MTYIKLHNPNTHTIYQFNADGDTAQRLVKAGCEASETPFADVPVEDCVHDQHPKSRQRDYGAGIDPSDVTMRERLVMRNGARVKLIETIYPRGGMVTTVDDVP